METADLGLDLVPESQAKGKKAAPSEPKLYRGKAEYAPPYYTINIAFVEHQPEYETISVNGEVLQVQRGVDVPNIPQAYLNVLKNAVASRQVKRVNADRSEYYEWQPYPAVPYQIVEGPYNERKAV